MIPIWIVEFRPVRLILFATLVGAGKGAEHGSVIAGFVALVALGLLAPSLPCAVMDDLAGAVTWARERSVR